MAQAAYNLEAFAKRPPRLQVTNALSRSTGLVRVQYAATRGVASSDSAADCCSLSLNAAVCILS